MKWILFLVAFVAVASLVVGSVTDANAGEEVSVKVSETSVEAGPGRILIERVRLRRVVEVESIPCPRCSDRSVRGAVFSRLMARRMSFEGRQRILVRGRCVDGYCDQD